MLFSMFVSLNMLLTGFRCLGGSMCQSSLSLIGSCHMIAEVWQVGGN